jgi:hypothetical protein
VNAPQWNDARDLADYEAEARARGQRESAPREDLVNDLPDFHHAPPVQVIPAPAARTPEARQAKHAAQSATRQRRATVATAREETLSALDRAVEALVRQHSSGAVIDAAWEASKRLFRPGARP